MTKIFLLSLCLIALCLPLQSCFLGQDSTEKFDPCESGEYEYTRFHKYDNKDSLAAILVVDNEMDTISQDYYTYDSTGFLTQAIWVYKNFNPVGDTSCHLFERINSGREIREFPCEDTSKTFSIAYLNGEKRTQRIAYYLSDTAIFNELLFTYNEKGLLIQVEIKRGDSVHIGVKNRYDESGTWIESIEFDTSGMVLRKTISKKETPTRIRTNIYDGEGKLLKWEVSIYDSRNKIEKSISCMSK